MKKKLIAILCISTLPAFAQSPPPAPDAFNFSYEARVTTNRTSRGVTDSGLKPSASFTVNVLHESGFAGLAEFATISKDSFTNGNGSLALLGLGYRNGDPDAFHYGGGFYYEFFPGAHYKAPLNLSDVENGNFAKRNFNTGTAIVEIGYGPIDVRYERTLTKYNRGITSGGICPFVQDPQQQFDCFDRGDASSATDYLSIIGKHRLTPQLELSGHIGVQRVRNFSQINLKDVRVSLDYSVNSNWVLGMDLTSTKVNRPDFFVTTRRDGSTFKSNKTTLAARVSYKF